MGNGVGLHLVVCPQALVGRARNVVFLGGASVISCNRTSNGELYYISQLLKQCFATHISVLLLNVVDFYYMLCKII